MFKTARKNSANKILNRFIVIETYAQILDFEGRLHKDKIYAFNIHNLVKFQCTPTNQSCKSMLKS